MFDHVVIYKDSDDYFLIQDESELRNELYVIVDNEIDTINKKESLFKYTLSYRFIDKFNKKMFVIRMINKEENSFSEKLFFNFDFAKDYFKSLIKH